MQDGQIFLDYGCGTGDFTVVAAKLVGTEGKVYALDCFSRQLSIVKKKSRKKGLNNVVTILSDGTTGLSDASVDVVWMCDVFHEVREKRALLEELRRVLKEDGELVVYDAMREGILRYTSGLFSLTGRDDKLLRFAR
ncbi:MAG: methyltransferase domain-containing protein [Chloroflexi bacterium]|nr:methyltransferase domain-containing protein [Chloroflexota bacterium]